MKITCFIDQLGSGGAQRQLVALATYFKSSGHQVAFLTYHEDKFFKPSLELLEIKTHTIQATSKLQRVLVLRKYLNAQRPDVVLAFLEGPSLYSELAGFPRRTWGLVVSERLQVGETSSASDWPRSFHRFADFVTTNSHATRRILARRWNFISRKLSTIYNCLDLEAFRPAFRTRTSKLIRLVLPASYQERKNTMGIVRALAILRQMQPAREFVVDCYGGHPLRPDGGNDTAYFERVREEILWSGLSNYCRLHAADSNILAQYNSCDAVILPSFVEGLPNAICEGMACGLPVLTSDIGDARLLVKDGVNGFLFDPSKPQSIANAIANFCWKSDRDRAKMGLNSREIAEVLFEPSTTGGAYLRLLEACSKKSQIDVRHWPPEDFGPDQILARGSAEIAHPVHELR